MYLPKAAIDASEWLDRWSWSISRGETNGKVWCGLVEYSKTSRAPSWYGRGSINSRATTENTDVVAPIPSASVARTVSVNAGVRRRLRSAMRMSCRN